MVTGLLATATSLACSKGPSGSSASEDTMTGRELFMMACSRCHGREGRGGVPITERGPSPRNFHDHAFQTTHTDDQIKLTIVNGKPPSMPPFGTMFTEVQLASLVAFVRTCDPGNP